MAETAQAVFKTKESEDLKKRKSLINRGMLLWDTTAEHYRALPEQYKTLLEEKRKNKIPVGRLRSGIVNDYPVVRFFEIEDRDEALSWLSQKGLARLEDEISSISFVLEENYSYRTMRDWVKEAIYQIDHRRNPRTLMY